MDRKRILVLYGTSYGQTEKIAKRIGELLGDAGLDPDVVRGDGVPVGFDPAGYDGIIVGASLIARGHQRYVADFVRRNRRRLNTTPSAFFSVSASAGSHLPEARQAAREKMEEFLEETGWSPARRTTFAGAINYTKYGLLLRLVMRWISARNGGETDTTRDHEYTDWSQVESFADDFAEIFAPVPAAG